MAGATEDGHEKCDERCIECNSIGVFSEQPLAVHDQQFQAPSSFERCDTRNDCHDDTKDIPRNALGRVDVRSEKAENYDPGCSSIRDAHTTDACPDENKNQDDD